MAEINWGELKAAAIALNSVNEAAKQAATLLPTAEAERFRERVNKRAYRERWLDKAQTLTLSKSSNALPLSKPVQSGSQALANSLKGQQNKSRNFLAKFVVNASKVASRSRSPLSDAGKVRDVASVMEKVWPEEKQGDAGAFNLNMICSQAVVQVDSGTQP